MFFVKYVFYFTREVDNNYIDIVHFTSEIKDIFNKKHLNFLFIIYKFPINFLGKETRILLYISFCFHFLVVADEFIKAHFY